MTKPDIICIPCFGGFENPPPPKKNKHRWELYHCHSYQLLKIWILYVITGHHDHFAGWVVKALDWWSGNWKLRGFKTHQRRKVFKQLLIADTALWWGTWHRPVVSQSKSRDLGSTGTKGDNPCYPIRYSILNGCSPHHHKPMFIRSGSMHGTEWRIMYLEGLQTTNLLRKNLSMNTNTNPNMVLRFWAYYVHLSCKPFLLGVVKSHMPFHVIFTWSPT